MSFISLMELIGTVAFAVSGALVAIEKKLDIYGVTFLAIITAVGGGVLRDLFAREIPFVFKKEVYATACIIGAVAFLLSYPYTGVNGAMYICFGVTLVIRLICVKFNWNLATVKIDETKGKEKTE